MKEKLFPNFVCRVSGLPTEKISNLSSEKLKQLTSDIFNIDQEINKLKEVISNELYELINKAEQKSIRSKIIKLRRDIYNKKEIDITKTINNTSITEKCHQLIKEYSKLVKNKNRLYSKYERVYKQEIVRIRDTFKYQLQDEYFQKGLLISSDSLFNSQGNYIKTDSRNLNGKQEQIERGLLRYYSRMAMKATPFGTFCSIIPGVIEDDLPCDYLFTSDPYNKKSIVLLNKWIYGALTRYIKRSEELKPYINLELNPTVVKKNNELVFLASIYEKEVFQHIEINEVIELLYEQLQKYTEIKYKDLVQKVAAIDEIDATDEEIVTYLDGLINIGLLRYKFGIADQEEDWDILLIDVLKKIPNKKSKIVVDFLTQLRNKRQLFTRSSHTKRSVILEEIKILVEETFAKIDIKEKLHNDLPLYEDSTGNSVLKIKTSLFKSSIPKIAQLLSILRQMAYPRADNFTMRHFYDTYYKNRFEHVKLLDFYEDYYREHFKEHLEKEQKLKEKRDYDELKKYNISNPFNLESIKIMQGFWSKFHNLVVRKWIENEDVSQINITESELDEIIPEINPVISPRHSVSAFGECLFPEDGNRKMKMIYPGAKSLLGFGKYFSRFLKLFDENQQRKVFNNNQCFEEILFAEICGDANFNANLHPMLLKHEISYPTGEGGNSPEKIATSDIVVVAPEEDQNALYLKRISNGKRIIPLDLGFMNPRMRPPLFQLISKFCIPVTAGLHMPQTMTLRNDSKDISKPQNKPNPLDENKNTDDSKILYRPRIVYEDEIILARRTWIVPSNHFPAMRRDEDGYEYLFKLNLWRIENNIPSEVYVKITPLPLLKQNDNRNLVSENEVKPGLNNTTKGEVKDKITANSETIDKEKKDNKKLSQKMSRDYYKPQYIDFSNPLLGNLFGKMTVNLKNFTINIEEKLPRKDQLLKYGNKSYTTEFIFQIDFYEEQLINKKQSKKIEMGVK